MKKYTITNLNEFKTLMVKTTDEIKLWISKYNVKDNKGNPVDLRKAKDGYVVKVNGKFLRIFG